MIVTTRTMPDGYDVEEYERDYFLHNVWVHKPGEHVSIIGPTEAGKTTLGYQLLDVTTTPKQPGVVLVMKPRDETAEKFGKAMGYETIRTWPPMGNPFASKKPRGWTLWPKHDFDPAKGISNTIWEQYRQFNKAFADCYKKGHKILFADELAAVCDELGMRAQVLNHYSRGRSQEAAIWGATQRPVDVPRIAYSSAHHLFLAHDPDEADRKRFAEIGGGIDPKLVESVTMSLPQYWWLYLRRKDRTLCIVRA